MNYSTYWFIRIHTDFHTLFQNYSSLTMTSQQTPTLYVGSEADIHKIVEILKSRTYDPANQPVVFEKELPMPLVVEFGVNIGSEHPTTERTSLSKTDRRSGNSNVGWGRDSMRTRYWGRKTAAAMSRTRAQFHGGSLQLRVAAATPRGFAKAGGKGLLPASWPQDVDEQRWSGGSGL